MFILTLPLGFLVWVVEVGNGPFGRTMEVVFGNPHSLNVPLLL